MTPRCKLYKLSGGHSPDDEGNDQFRQSYHQYDDKYSGGSECNECNESSLWVCYNDFECEFECCNLLQVFLL